MYSEIYLFNLLKLLKEKGYTNSVELGQFNKILAAKI
jgi:hypothetical protein